MGRTMKDSGLPWIGQIPSNWRCLRGKYALRYLQKSTKEDDGVITCFRDGEVTLRSNRREEGFTISEKEIGYQGIDVGDLVVHGMDGFAGSIGISDSRGKASPVLVVLDSNENKRFLMYYLRNLAYRDVFLALATGIRVRSCDLRWNKIAETVFVLPPIDEQSRIVSFIDNKLSEIDAAISEAQALIDKYKSFKQSVIFEAVTKGLDPHVPMKDSGVEWIGEIPEHWKLSRMDVLFSEGTQKNIFYEFDHAMKFTYGELVPKNEEGDISELKGTYLAYSVIEENDIAINGLNLNFDFVSQRVARCPKRGILTSAYLILKPNDKRYSRYFTYQLKSWDNQKVFHGMGKGVRLTLSFSEVKKMLMPIPTFEEQQSIAEYLDDKCMQIDSIISEKEQLISRLQEYKKSIIFEYVTGKKEVTNG